MGPRDFQGRCAAVKPNPFKVPMLGTERQTLNVTHISKYIRTTATYAYVHPHIHLSAYLCMYV